MTVFLSDFDASALGDVLVEKEAIDIHELQNDTLGGVHGHPPSLSQAKKIEHCRPTARQAIRRCFEFPSISDRVFEHGSRMEKGFENRACLGEPAAIVRGVKSLPNVFADDLREPLIDLSPGSSERSAATIRPVSDWSP